MPVESAPEVCTGRTQGVPETAGHTSLALTPFRGREIDLDFLRGVAILMVLDFHAPVHWMFYALSKLGFPHFGWAGVDVFFILSGFLVGGLLIREQQLKGSIDSQRFLIRRGFKIWPQYYVFLGFVLLTGHRSVHELWGNLLNIQNYVGGIPHTWSLAVEEHAYLLLVLCMVLATRVHLRVRTFFLALAFTCGVVVLGRLFLAEHGYPVVTATHTRLEGILYGVMLAMVYHHRPGLFQRMQGQRWLWAAVLCAALLFLRFQTQAPWAASVGWDAANLLGIALLMLLYRPGQKQQRPALYRLVAWIGVYSYGIYLWHVSVIKPIVLAGGYMPRGIAAVWLALMPAVAGIALGALFTRLVEFPALKMRERFYPRPVDSPIGTFVGEPRKGSMLEIKAEPQAMGA